MRPVSTPSRSTMRTCERASPVLSPTVFQRPTGEAANPAAESPEENMARGRIGNTLHRLELACDRMFICG